MAMEQRQQDECGKKFMVAIDESESSHYALMWVLQNLRESIAQPGNKLYVFMAVPRAQNNSIFSASLGSARMYCNVSPTASFVNAVQETNNLVSVGILEKAKAICTSHGLNAETVTVVGDAREAICEAAEKCNINLLVLGDHGTSKIRRALLGSVSNYCVQNAKCPVLVVKKPE